MPNMQVPTTDPIFFRRYLSMKEVCFMTSLSRTEIYRKIAAGTFPAPYKLGEAKIGFLYSEVIEWQDKRPRIKNANVPDTDH